MKRVFSVFLAALMVTALCACDKTPETSPATDTLPVTTESVTDTAPDTDAPDTDAPDTTDPATEQPETTLPDTEGQKGTDGPTTSATGKTTATTKKPVAEGITALSPANGASLYLCNDLIDRWMSDYTRGTTPSYIGEKPVEQNQLKALTLKWACPGEPQYFNVAVATKKDLSDAMRYLTVTPSLLIEEPLTDTNYYWQVTATYADKTVKSDVFTFYSEWTPRIVRVEGVSNFRDIGGWMTTDNKKIRQGLVYRCASIDGITDEGKRQAIGLLGIKTDLDLRSAGEGTAGKGTSPIGEDINYILAGSSGGAHYDDMYSDKQKTLAKEIKVFADPENYPIVFHCTVGRDRTGTLCFALLTLLGVDANDVFNEYELAFFSEVGWNSNPNSFVDGIVRITNAIKGYPGATNAEKMANFLMGNGVTADEIAAIRSLLLEEA